MGDAANQHTTSNTYLEDCSSTGSVESAATKAAETSMHRIGQSAGAIYAGITSLGRIVAEAITGLTYPPCCLGCGGRLYDVRTLLCLGCFEGIDRASRAEVDSRLQRLPEAQAVLDRVACLWIFDKDGAMQAVHQALKYGNRPSYGLTLGEPMGAIFLENCRPEDEIDIIVPIPLHRARLLERGYNQSAMLAAGVRAVIKKPVVANALIRPRPTRTQTSLRRASRWKNLLGAFCVRDAALVRDRRVLLVDDVLTTGSTAGAAATVLREAGASHVDLVTLGLART